MADTNTETLEEKSELWFHPSRKKLYYRDELNKLIELNVSENNKDFDLKEKVIENKKLALKTKLELLKLPKSVYLFADELNWIKRQHQMLGNCYYAKIKLNSSSKFIKLKKRGFYLSPNSYLVNICLSFDTENILPDNYCFFFLRSNRVIVNSLFSEQVRDTLPKNKHHQFHINVRKPIYLELACISKNRINLDSDSILITIVPLNQ